MQLGKVFVRGKVQPHEEGPKDYEQLRLATEVSAPQKFSSRDGKSLVLPLQRPSLSSFTALQRTRLAPRLVMFVVGSACLLWTLLLLQFTIAPNYTVNWIMKTQSFDGGSFWLLVDPSSTLLALGILGLWGVAAGFLSLLVRIVKLEKPILTEIDGGKLHKLRPKLNHVTNDDNKLHRFATSAQRVVKEVLLGDNVMGYFTKVCLKLCDSMTDVVLLYLNLEAGTPVALVVVFTGIVVASALANAALLSLPSDKNSLFVETLVDTVFDFLVAIAYPWLALAYCTATFSFNYEMLNINLDIYPAGWFETVASVLADPVQTAVIHRLLKSLRIVSVLDFFARVGVNLLLCVRLHSIVELLHDTSWQQKRPIAIDSRQRYLAGSLFIFLSVMLIVFVEESVRTSTIACKPHVECAVNAWRWTYLHDGSLNQCPCLALIEVDAAPKSFAQWIQPKNVTDKVAQLANTGDLQTVQLINRFLPVLPTELRGCSQLKHLSLVYTHTRTLPNWFKDFTHLEYLHIEGTPESSLVSLQVDLFNSMPSLTFLHLAGHASLSYLPSFDGLRGLKSLTLAVLPSVTELPQLTNLTSLERLQLSSMHGLDCLPDMTLVSSTLASFVVSDRGTWCCNGFLGLCDLQNPLCGVHPVFGTPAAFCWTGDAASAGTLKIVTKFAESVCGEVLQKGTLEISPTKSGMDQCNGTLYRQCFDPGYPEAMCYNARYMGIACTPNPYPIAMRRRQIKESIGFVCDPKYEAWLGCE